ncbi:MAG: tetratricopeptide repeat protein [Luteolibacter sp.]
MKPRKFIRPAMVGALFAVVLLAVPARAGDIGLTGLAEQSSAAMEAGNWQAALDLSNRAVQHYGQNNPLESFGAQFGVMYYRKGVCEMKLKRWDEAMASLEICYRDFPNDDAAAEGGGNVSQKLALLKWGEAAMGAENWELALSRFRKFLEERDKARDRFPQGAFYINMALCHYQLGRIPEGNENLEIAINNRHGFPTPDDGIIAGVQALVATAIAKHNEQALLDFLEKNRGGLVSEPYVMHRFSRVFLKLAGDVTAADMQRAAMALYQFVPSAEIALEEARARLKITNEPSEKELLQKDIAELEAERKGNNAPEMIRLVGIAYLHEKNGNVRGAFAAYQQLESLYPASQNREENLFNLVRTSSIVAGPDITRGYAETFLKDFPKSSHVPELQNLLR